MPRYSKAKLQRKAENSKFFVRFPSTNALHLHICGVNHQVQPYPYFQNRCAMAAVPFLQLNIITTER